MPSIDIVAPEDEGSEALEACSQMSQVGSPSMDDERNDTMETSSQIAQVSDENSAAVKDEGNSTPGASSQVPQEEVAPFPFMRLPAQIRFRIYTMVLAAPKPIVLTVVDEEKKSRWSAVDRVEINHNDISSMEFFLPSTESVQRMGFLRLNRQIHREASSILYFINEFICPSMRALGLFLVGITERNVIYLRSLAVDDGIFNMAESRYAFELLAWATKIKYLTLCPDKFVRSGSLLPIYEAMQPWLISMARDHDDPQAGLKVIEWLTQELKDPIAFRCFGDKFRRQAVNFMEAEIYRYLGTHSRRRARRRGLRGGYYRGLGVHRQPHVSHIGRRVQNYDDVESDSQPHVIRLIPPRY